MADAPPVQSRPLEYEVREGLNLNRFIREGEVAAHLVLRSGNDPRILIAFPAGNSGVGIWFTHLARAAEWTLASPPRPIRAADDHGRPLYGIVFDASVRADDLAVRQTVLSSVRTLRDYESLGTVPAELIPTATKAGQTLRWSRDRLDGAPGYRLEVEVLHGEQRDGHLRAGSDGTIGLRIRGFSGETPLTALAGEALLADPAAAEARARDTLTFLSTREKLLAGSWRFDTYFGRDTLMSVQLLMSALAPTAIEAALSSVLARLSARGEVAHEEDIGERAVLDHLRDGTRSAAPVYDYKMIDGNYLLAPVIATWLLQDARAHARAAAFLDAPAQSGAETRTRGAALVENFRFVLTTARTFADSPTRMHLLALKPGIDVGEWRDSRTGLGGGRFPYDVNAVLVPAALDAIARLERSGLLAPFLAAQDRALFARAGTMAAVWRTHAPPLFDVTLAAPLAVHAIEAYAAAAGVTAQPAIAALGGQAVRFHAIALDAAGDAIPVMHSDEGFALLFESPDAQRLDETVLGLMRPFPAGLMTGAGMLVANPAFCSVPLQAEFSRNAYHGTVVWSWQQAMFAAGLARQLERTDLPPTVHSHLQRAQRTLWSAIETTSSLQNSELWSWSFSGGRYHVEAFGAATADADESNAAQLWSTVYLAVKPPHAH